MPIRASNARRRPHNVRVPLLQAVRRDLLGLRKSWEELDEPNWRKDEGDDSHWGTVEAFFDFIYGEFS